MATAVYNITNTAYTTIPTGSEALVQNITNWPIVLRFDTSLPDVSDEGHTLEAVQGIQKVSGSPGDTLYAITRVQSTAKLVVS